MRGKARKDRQARQSDHGDFHIRAGRQGLPPAPSLAMRAGFAARPQVGDAARKPRKGDGTTAPRQPRIARRMVIKTLQARYAVKGRPENGVSIFSKRIA
jgi:hypothetical protein